MNLQFINLQTTHTLYALLYADIFHNETFKLIFKRKISHWAKHYSNYMSHTKDTSIRKANKKRHKQQCYCKINLNSGQKTKIA